MKTHVLKSGEVTRKWYVIDAKDKPLGRVAAKAAMVLMGKHKAAYAPNIDNGDFVIILNAAGFSLSGRKMNTKVYNHYSGHPSGMKTAGVKFVLEKKPMFPMEKAIKGMLPKNKLADKMIKKLYLFKGEEHKFRNVSLEKLDI